MTDKTQKFKPSINPENTSVQEMFGQILQQRIQEGIVEKAITEKIDALIDDCVTEAFRSYGDIAKSIKNTITKSITPDIKSLGDLPTYHHFVMQNIKSAMTRFQDEKLKSVLDKEMQEIFEELPEKLTLSWLIEQLKEHIRSNEERDEFELTLIIDNDGSFTHIYIDTEEGKEKWECGYQIDLNRGEIYSTKIGDKDMSKAICVGPLYRFEKIMFNAYAMKANLTLDKGISPSEYDIHIEANYDY